MAVSDKNIGFTIVVSKAQYNELKELAELNCCSAGSIVRRAIADYLEKINREDSDE